MTKADDQKSKEGVSIPVVVASRPIVSHAQSAVHVNPKSTEPNATDILLKQPSVSSDIQQKESQLASAQKQFMSHSSSNLSVSPTGVVREAVSQPAPQADSSSVGEVNEIVKGMEDKKRLEEELKAETEREAKVDELIEKQTYFVHLSSSTGSLKNIGIVLFVALLALLAVGYVLVDLDIIPLSVKLPFELFK